MKELVEFNNKKLGSASIIALPNGKRPRSNFRKNKFGRVTTSIVTLVSKWEESLPKHFTSGSRLPSYEHTKTLNSKRGIWNLLFQKKEDGSVEITMNFISSEDLSEVTFTQIRAEQSEGIYMFTLPPMEEAYTKMFDLLLGLGGILLPAIDAGINRVTNPDWNDLYDWN